MIRRVKQAIIARVWAAIQYPDPDRLYRRGGLGQIIRLLNVCPDGDRTREILAKFGARIDPATTAIAPCVTIHPPRPERGVEGFGNLHVGANVHIGWDVFLDLSDEVRIGDDVHIGMRAVILTHFFLGERSARKPLAGYFPPREAPVILERGCAVGAGSIILPGVTIGEDALVGAGAVVKASVPPRAVVEPAPSGTVYVLPDRETDGGPAREGARPQVRTSP